MSQIWCGIPVFNNAATITDVAKRCREQIANVVVVDDGSTDADLVDLLKPLDVAVVRHPANLGKGAALLTAFGYAAKRGAEYVITLDGDGQHFPEDMPRFFPRLAPDVILIGRRDQVVGIMPDSSVFGREFSDFWICVECGAAVQDSQSGFRAYPLKHVMNLNLESRHYNMEMEIITRAIWAGLRTQSVPIRVWYPDPLERVSSFHPVRDNFRISLLHLRLILRNLLPIPHRRLPGIAAPPSRRLAQWFKRFRTENASPLGLAAAAVVTILPGMVLWPWGWFVVLYLALRLHLNKFMVIAMLALCMPPAVPAVCLRLGRYAIRSDAHPHLAWFVGAHLVALPAAIVMALLVYRGARMLAPGVELTATASRVQ